jgi:hypothetical protein
MKHYEVFGILIIILGMFVIVWLGLNKIHSKVIISAVVAVCILGSALLVLKDKITKIKIPGMGEIETKLEKVREYFNTIESVAKVANSAKDDIDNAKTQIKDAEQQLKNLNESISNAEKTFSNLEALSVLETEYSRAKRGNRKSFDLVQNHTYDGFSETHQEYIQSRKEDLSRFRLDYANNNNYSQRLIKIKNRQLGKWSVEYLYKMITTKNSIFTDKDIIKATFNEIAIRKDKYLVETLYDIAINDNNIFYAIDAARTLCKITDYAPYPQGQYSNSHRQFVSDSLKFERLKKWWGEEGSKVKEYKCPFKDFIPTDKNNLYFDPINDETVESRLKKLKDICKDFPLLYKTQAEILYLTLANDNLPYIKQEAEKIVSQCDTELLPYMVLVYIALKNKDNASFEKWMNKMIEFEQLREISTCVMINTKFRPILEAVVMFLQKHDKE